MRGHLLWLAVLATACGGRAPTLEAVRGLAEREVEAGHQTRYEPTVREVAGHVGGLGLLQHFFPAGGAVSRPAPAETR